MSPDDFGNLIKQKFPTGVTSDGRSYADLSNHELTQKVIEKYPVYRSQVKFGIDTFPKLGDIASEAASSIADTAKQGVSSMAEGAKGLFTPPDIRANDVQAAYKGGGLGAGAAELGAQALQGGVHAVANLGKIVGGAVQTAASPILGPATKLGTAIGNSISPSIPTPSPEISKVLENPAVRHAASDTLDIANLAIPEAKTPIREAMVDAKNIGSDALGSVRETVSNVAEKAKNASTEAQTKAIDSLENDYYKWGGATKVGAKNIAKTDAKTEALNRAGTTGKTPQRVLAESGIIPETQGTKFSTADQANELRQSVQPLNETLSRAAREVDMAAPPRSIDELEQSAVQRIGQQAMPESDRAALVRDVQEEFGLLKQRYGKTLSATQMQELKPNYWGGTKFDSTKPFKGTAYYQVGKSLQKGIEDMSTEAGFEEVAQLNREIGDKLEAAKYLESLNGNTLKYGKIGKYAFMMVGATLGQGLVGKLFGALGGEAVGELLMRADVATPLKRRILDTIKAKDPEAYKETLQWMKQQGIERDSRLQLPAGGESSAPIELPGEGILQSQQKINQSRPNNLSMPTASKNATTDNISDTIPSSNPKVEGGGPEALPENLKDNYAKFPRDNKLTGEDAQVQEASILKYLTQKEELLKEYIEKYGKVANADEARKLFSDVGYKGTNAAAVQEAASALNKDVWRANLASNSEPDAILYAGGSGNGKTSTIDGLIPDVHLNAAAILDGNLSTLKTALNRITEAVEAGKTAKVVYVYRDPADAWLNGVISRMKGNKKEGGRVVPLSVFLQNHAGSHAVVKELINRGIPTTLIDNSLGRNRHQFMSLDKFNNVVYNEENLRSKLEALTKREYEQGHITDKQYNALIQ